MAFKTGSNTVITNTPDIAFAALANKPAVMAQTVFTGANGVIRQANFVLTGNTLTITTG